MFKISNFTDNDDVTVLKEFGAFKTIEWKRDLSVNEASAMNAYFASEMNVRRRQVICDLSQAPVTVQAGAMQWMVGNVTCTTGVKGVGDLFGKALRGAVTSESAIKPEYQGTGLLVLEPTYRYIITLDVADWAIPSCSTTACSWRAIPASSTKRLCAATFLPPLPATKGCSTWASRVTARCAWNPPAPKKSLLKSPWTTTNSRSTATWRWPGADPSTSRLSAQANHSWALPLPGKVW